MKEFQLLAYEIGRKLNMVTAADLMPTYSNWWTKYATEKEAKLIGYTSKTDDLKRVSLKKAEIVFCIFRLEDSDDLDLDGLLHELLQYVEKKIPNVSPTSPYQINQCGQNFALLFSVE